MTEIKEPPHAIVKKDGPFEIRQYAPGMIAEIVMRGDRQDAIKKGFRVLADYIFGKNVPNLQIPMTAPVTQESIPGYHIPLTTPLVQQRAENEEDAWKIHLFLPPDYTIETLPMPQDARVKIIPMRGHRAAIVRFSGLGQMKTLEDKTAALKNWIAGSRLHEDGPPVYAFYNRSWTLPFLRRNEVMIRLAP